MKAKTCIPCITTAAISLFLLLAPSPAGAGDRRLPVKTRVAILLKALTYDHNLKTRCSGGLRIGVVGLAGNETSMSIATETYKEVMSKSSKKVSGLSISATQITAASAADIQSAVNDNNLNNLYFAPGLEPMMNAALKLSRKKKILTMSGESGHDQSGVAVIVVMRDKKPKILVNTEAATQQGAALDARLLRLAEVIQPASKYQPPDTIKKRRIKGRDPKYPGIARTARKEAKIIVKIYITPDGDVGKMKFMRTDPHFEDEVREAIKTWKFTPHKINNRPVGTYTVYKFDFKLD
jgi:TonB family protein